MALGRWASRAALAASLALGCVSKPSAPVPPAAPPASVGGDAGAEPLGAPPSPSATATLASTERRYTFELRSSVHGGLARSLDVTLTGTLGLADLGGSGVRLAVRDARVAAADGAATGAQTVPELERPFFVSRDARGLPARLTFAAIVPPATRQLLQFAAAALMVVAPDAAAKPTWTGAERDGSGDYTAVYRRERRSPDGVELVRTKLGPIKRPGGGAIDVEASTSRLVLAGAGALREVTIDETLVLPQLGTKSATRLHARRGEDARVEGATPPADGAVGWRTFALGDAGVASEEERDRALVHVTDATAGPMLGELLAALAAEGTGDSDGRTQTATLERLLALLRLAPALLPEARRRLASGGPQTEWIVVAIGRAGSPAAQRELGAILDDTSVTATLRERAAAESMKVRAPVPALVAALERAAARAPAGAGTPGPEAKASAMALVALGAAAFHLRASDRGGARGIVELLLARLRAGGDRLLAVQALGNAGAGAAGPELVRLATSDADPGLRAGAVRALRLIEDAAAAATIDRVMHDDAAPEVRAAAVVSTTEQGLELHRKALVVTLLYDKDASVRRTTAGLLGRWASDERVQRAMKHSADHDADSGVREAARRSLRRAQ